MKFILLLVYLWRGQIAIEQTPFVTGELCERAGAIRTQELVKDPRFGGGIVAACVPVEMQEAQK